VDFAKAVAPPLAVGVVAEVSAAMTNEALSGGIMSDMSQLVACWASLRPIRRLWRPRSERARRSLYQFSIMKLLINNKKNKHLHSVRLFD